tara:strand:+ start:1710 stop:3281 length:1572 start_codon:yes stop_codon:yes gene_type:complete
MLLLSLLPGTLNAQELQSGDLAYRMDMTALAKQSRTMPSNAQWVEQGPDGQTCYQINVTPQQKSGSNVMSIPIDLSPYRGMIMQLSCKAKAQNVTQPRQSWNGIKCMLNYKSPTTGEQWHNQGNVFGSFDWKTINCQFTVADDATNGQLLLEMQDCAGTAWISDVTITVVRTKPIRPTLAANPGPAYKGHNLPRLRGFMSPQQFREEDFADLEKWNVNLIRWQITRHWGKANTDTNLDDYDAWIDDELADLHKAADAAKRHGIKLMIDLHSPPGGRLEDRSIRMFVEKKYQDHFIKVWQKIATQFKDHPAIWAYDLINEPVQNQLSPEGVGNWLQTQVLAANAIRKIDPETAISIEVDGWDAPANFAWLAPVDIPNVIYQVHMYWPGQFTHQGVHNTWGEDGGDPRVEYPGKLNGKPFDKAALRKQLQPVRDFQRQCNAHIIVGEFSAIRWAPGAATYLADCIDIFEEYGWDWTYHAFREWPGWSVEHANLPADRKHHVKSTTLTDRAKVLQKWFDQNKRVSQ